MGKLGHLGDPAMSETSLKLQGPWEVRRSIRIPGISHPADALSVKKALSRVPGVRAMLVSLAKRLVRVPYEVTITDYQFIEHALEDVGFPPAEGWWARRRTHWFQQLDLTGRENASGRSSPCCNKSPVYRK